jgi:hypothetical protein
MNWSELDNIFKGVDFRSLPKVHSDRASAWQNVNPESLSELMFQRLDPAFFGIAKVTPALKKVIKQAITMAYSSANVDGTETNHPTFKEFLNHTGFIRWDFTNFYDKEWNRQRLQYLVHGDVLRKTIDEEIIGLYRQLKQYEIFREDLNMLSKVKCDILNLISECPDYAKYLTALEIEKIATIHRKHEYPKIERVKVEEYKSASDKEMLLNYLRSLLKYYKGAEDDLPDIPFFKALYKKLSQHLSH